MPTQLEFFLRQKCCRSLPTIVPHPFRPGQLVTVFGFGHFRRPFIEGRAVICANAGAPNLYKVRFEGSRRECERLVHEGDWQDHPNRLLKQLMASWAASLTPSLLRDFFADEVRLQESQS